MVSCDDWLDNLDGHKIIITLTDMPSIFTSFWVHTAISIINFKPKIRTFSTIKTKTFFAVICVCMLRNILVTSRQREIFLDQRSLPSNKNIFSHDQDIQAGFKMSGINIFFFLSRFHLKSPEICQWNICWNLSTILPKLWTFDLIIQRPCCTSAVRRSL